MLSKILTEKEKVMKNKKLKLEIKEVTRGGLVGASQCPVMGCTPNDPTQGCPPDPCNPR